MARYSGAVWDGDDPNFTQHGMRNHYGLILHIQSGTEGGTDSWFDNPNSQVSAHFGIPKVGDMQQFVDTDDEAWAEMAGNPDYISAEIEGMSGDSCNQHQLDLLAGLFSWGAMRYSWPYVSIDTPGQKGLGWHGMGGAAWGGHINCPGAPIKAQRGVILNQARQIGGPKPMFDPAIGPVASAREWQDGGVLLLNPDGSVYSILGAPYWGGANGQPYFVGHTAVDFKYNTITGKVLKNAKGGYTILDAHGSEYNYYPA